MHLKSLVAVCVLGFFMLTEGMEGLQLEPVMLRCHCQRTTTASIKQKMIQKIELFPKRSYCETIEAIVTLKNGNQICVDPNGRWFQALIPKLSEIQKKRGAKQANGQTTMQTPY